MGKQIKNTMLGVIAGLYLGGCATLPEIKVGSSLPKPSMKFKMAIGGNGQIFLAQRLLEGAPPCFLLKEQMNVTVRRDGDPNPIRTEMSCTFLKSHLVAITKNNVEKGTYFAEIKKTEGIKGFLDKPRLLVRYEDPEFNSGTDYMIDGAKEMGKGETAKGTVSYPDGNVTDWYRIKGANAEVALTFMDNSPNRELTAQVYNYPPSARAPRLLATLSSKKRRVFKLKEDNILVRVTAKAYEGQGAYAIVRGDQGGGAGGGKLLKLSVIDCYSVGNNASVVLLKKSSDLKVNDEVTVFGRTPGGEMATIGQCQVSGIQGEQASCKMEGVASQNFVEYRAEARVKG